MNLQPINASASPETQINENFETLDILSVYAKDPRTTTALTWAYYGGRWSSFTVAAGTLTLTNTATNYIVVAKATGVISVSTAITNWNDATNYSRVYLLTTAGGVVTATADHRAGSLGIFALVGGTGTMADQNASGLTVAVNDAATVTVASATTTDIGAAASNNVDISGVTTITGFGTVAAGAVRRGRFTGILTLTHNATSLILPGGANITTAANDRYEAVSLGAGNWLVLNYVRAADTKVPLGTMATQDASAYLGNNLIINSGFTVNQRAYASGAALASGSFGHDRWKAGAGGGDYSFTQLASNTTITIAANKTLLQVVEDKMVQDTSYVLSWTGTAQARYAVNSATPAGAYAASPITITGQNAGSTLSVEFGNGASTGTLGSVLLVPGAVQGNYVARPPGLELMLCQRYCPAWAAPSASQVYWSIAQCFSTTGGQATLPYMVPPRVVPTGVSVSSASHFGVLNAAAGAFVAFTALSLAGPSLAGLSMSFTVASGLAAGDAGMWGSNNASALIYGTGCEL